MFKKIKEYREKKEKVRLAIELNNEIYKRKSELIAYAEEISKGSDRDLLDSTFMFNTLWHLDHLKVDENSEFELNCHTIEELANAKKLVTDSYNELWDAITSYWDRAKKNKEELNELFENGVPLFITLTSVSNGMKKYAMCYEIKKYKYGEFKAYLFTGDRKEGHMDIFTYLDYKIEPMTEEEFEQYYIMLRMGVTNFNTEAEAIEYDNYLRRLFHGQREVI